MEKGNVINKEMQIKRLYLFVWDVKTNTNTQMEQSSLVSFEQ